MDGTPHHEDANGGREPLSRADAVELTAQIAALTSAQIPLALGLSALANDLPRGRLARTMRNLAGYLERGIPLDRAATMPEVRLPPYLCGLLACGLQSDRLGPVLEQFLAHERLRADLKRRIWTAMAYPCLLAVLLALWIAFVAGVLVKDIESIALDFEVEIPPSTRSLLAIADYLPQIALGVVGGVVMALVLMRLFGRTRVASDLIAAVPLVGPLWRNRGVSEFASLLALLLENAVPLPKALELTATGLDDGSLADACRRSARLAESGQTLSHCAARVRKFPPTLAPIFAWGDRRNASAESLQVAAEWFRSRCDLQSELLAVVVPPISFLFVAVTMLFVVSALFAPLVQLIRLLT